MPGMNGAKSTGLTALPLPTLALRSPFWPVFVWALIQGGALALIAARLPFFATKSFPQPAEVLGLQVMLVAQIVGSAMLFPFLLRDLRSSAMVIAMVPPFTVLGTFLTGLIEWRQQTAVSAFVTVWLAGLALWRVALPSERSKAIGVAIAVLAAVGGPIAWYLRAEYAPPPLGSATDLPRLAMWGPIFAAIGVALRDPQLRPAWYLAAAHFLLGAAAWTTHHFWGGRDTFSPNRDAN
jgi:hypothetical protein